MDPDYLFMVGYSKGPGPESPRLATMGVLVLPRVECDANWHVASIVDGGNNIQLYRNEQ
jgi:hypothetical protein